VKTTDAPNEIKTAFIAFQQLVERENSLHRAVHQGHRILQWRGHSWHGLTIPEDGQEESVELT
jgi:hypothetical protein